MEREEEAVAAAGAGGGKRGARQRAEVGQERGGVAAGEGVRGCMHIIDCQTQEGKK